MVSGQHSHGGHSHSSPSADLAAGEKTDSKKASKKRIDSDKVKHEQQKNVSKNKTHEGKCRFYFIQLRNILLHWLVHFCVNVNHNNNNYDLHYYQLHVDRTFVWQRT